MEHFFEKFKLRHEKEKIETIEATIANGVAFRGTNLWVLIFAIFVASLGLNVNSPAVIIGAMLISPLMGPIMGLGLGVGINDLALVRKSVLNYFIASGVALTTSTIFFLLSPLDDAHSEILARTAPTIYDVLIALFGGCAGIIAVSSKTKGNVIPGVAIATALMPPLCTAGYGLATLQFKFFFGAFYLYVINTVFIALATFTIVRLLHFPYRQLQNERSEKIARRIVWIIVTITFIPSLYFGYDLVRQNRFVKKANLFITNEANFSNDYLLNKKIDAKSKQILLIYGGAEIMPEDITRLTSQLKKYDLENATLSVKQGFKYLAETTDIEENQKFSQLTGALKESASRRMVLEAKLDSIKNEQKLAMQLFAELKVQYPNISSAILQPSTMIIDSAKTVQSYLVLLSTKRRLTRQETQKVTKWLKVRLNRDDLTLAFQ